MIKDKLFSINRKPKVVNKMYVEVKREKLWNNGFSNPAILALRKH